MNNNLIKILVVLGIAIVSFFTGNKIDFNNTESIITDSIAIDSTSIYLPYLKERDSLFLKVDSLEKELKKKPKYITKYVDKPVPLIIRGKDTTVFKYDTIKIDSIVPIEVEVNETPVPILDNTEYAGELIVVGNNNKTTVKLNKKQIREGESIYLIEGENLENSLAILYNKESIKRKIKFKNISSVYVLLVSKDKDIADRLEKVIKNKNII
jgi:hypothetical protein